MKLKLFALLLTLVLAFACFASCSGSNDGGKNTDSSADSTENTGAIVGDDTSAPPVEGGKLMLTGEISDGIVTVKVWVSNNPGVAGYNLKINFDKTKLCPVEILDSDFASADAFASNIQQGPEVAATLDTVTAQYAQASDITEDGVLAAVSFSIVDGATGETEITLSADDITNQSLQDMVFDVEGCTVTLG